MPKREEGIDNIFHNLTITSTTVDAVQKEWRETADSRNNQAYNLTIVHAITADAFVILAEVS